MELNVANPLAAEDPHKMADSKKQNLQNFKYFQEYDKNPPMINTDK